MKSPDAGIALFDKVLPVLEVHPDKAADYAPENIDKFYAGIYSEFDKISQAVAAPMPEFKPSNNPSARARELAAQAWEAEGEIKLRQKNETTPEFVDDFNRFKLAEQTRFNMEYHSSFGAALKAARATGYKGLKAVMIARRFSTAPPEGNQPPLAVRALQRAKQLMQNNSLTRQTQRASSWFNSLRPETQSNIKAVSIGLGGLAVMAAATAGVIDSIELPPHIPKKIDIFGEISYY